MATINAYTPVVFTYTEFKRGVYDPMSMSEYVAGGSTVPDITITNAVPIGLTRVRLLLSCPVPSDSTWTTTGNYVLAGTGSPTVSSVYVGAGYIDLITTTHTAAASYTVTWSGLTGITASNDTYVPTALLNTGIKLGASTTNNVVTGNICRGGAITSDNANTVSLSTNGDYVVIS